MRLDTRSSNPLLVEGLLLTVRRTEMSDNPKAN